MYELIEEDGGSVHMFSHYKHAISKLFPDRMRTSSLAKYKSCFCNGQKVVITG